MEVRALHTDEEFHRYAHFGEVVYRDDPAWVAPDAHHVAKLISGRGAGAAHSQIQAFWAEEGGEILATLTAVIDEEYNRHWNEQMGHLFFFEALPDQDHAVAALFRQAHQWLRERGAARARLSFLIGWALPLTIDGYHQTPTILHGYNPPYYHSYIKDAGHATEMGAVEAVITFTPELLAHYQQVVAQVEQAGVRFRPWNLDNIEEENVLFTEMYNHTFAEHWGIQNVTTGVMSELTVDMKDFMLPQFLLFAEYNGHPIAALYAIPDINQALHRLRGKHIEEHLDEFQAALEAVDHGALFVLGIKKEHRGRDINQALTAKVLLAMAEQGYKTASCTIILDTNLPSRNTVARLGASFKRNFVIYGRAL